MTQAHAPAPDFPEFAVSLRGYERIQVEDYVTRLRDLLAEAEARADRAVQEANRYKAEAEALRSRRAEGAGELPPRLSKILSLAEEEAAERLGEARAEAERVLTNAAAERDRVGVELERRQHEAQAQLEELNQQRDRALEQVLRVHRALEEILETSTGAGVVTKE